MFHNLGSFLSGLVGIAPAAAAAGTVNGTGVTRRAVTGAGPDLSTVAMVLQTGATTGTPTSFTATAQLQHSTDGGSNWADIGDPVALAAENAIAIGSVNIQGAGALIRAEMVRAFVGGTAPTVLVSVGLVGLDEKNLP